MPRRNAPRLVTVRIRPDRIARTRDGRRAVAGEELRLPEDEAAALVRDGFAEDPDAPRREPPEDDDGPALVL